MLATAHTPTPHPGTCNVMLTAVGRKGAMLVHFQKNTNFKSLGRCGIISFMAGRKWLFAFEAFLPKLLARKLDGTHSSAGTDAA